MKKIARIKYETSGGKYRVTENWTHNLRPTGELLDTTLSIPSGYTTNGASVPRVFWWVLSPFNPRYMEEATIHDYLCDKGHYKRADAWFEYLLKENTLISKWHRKVFIISVRGWHWLAYKKAGYYGRAESRLSFIKNQ